MSLFRRTVPLFAGVSLALTVSGAFAQAPVPEEAKAAMAPLVPALKWMGVVAGATYLTLAFLDGFAYPWTAAGIAGGAAGGEE